MYLYLKIEGDYESVYVDCAYFKESLSQDDLKDISNSRAIVFKFDGSTKPTTKLTKVSTKIKYEES